MQAAAKHLASTIISVLTKLLYSDVHSKTSTEWHELHRLTVRLTLWHRELQNTDGKGKKTLPVLCELADKFINEYQSHEAVSSELEELRQEVLSHSTQGNIPNTDKNNNEAYRTTPLLEKLHWDLNELEAILRRDDDYENRGPPQRPKPAPYPHADYYAFRGAAKSGDVAAVKEFLDSEGADVNVQGGEYGNLLQEAVFYGHEPVIKLLPERGANVNAQGGKYGTAIQAAAGQGNEAVVKLLIERGADVNLHSPEEKDNLNKPIRNYEYGSALQAAAYHGHEAVVKQLLSYGADVNVLGGICGSPLHAAVYQNHEGIVRLLLDHGADVNVSTHFLGTALHAAAHAGDEAVFKLLNSHGADIHAHNTYNGSVLQAAAERGNEAIVQLLLSKSTDVNVRGGEHGTALVAAAWSRNEAIIQLLLSHGATFDRELDSAGVMEILGGSGDEGLMKLFIDLGADVNAHPPNRPHASALHEAIYNGQTDMIKFLVEHGADINADCGENDNPLQHAVSLVRMEKIVELLLELGADVHARGGFHGTVLNAAMSDNNEAVVEVLLKHGADVNAQGGWYGTALQTAACYGAVEEARLILEHGADVHARGGEYETALQGAAALGGKKMVKLLVEYGAVDVNGLCPARHVWQRAPSDGSTSPVP